MAIFDGTAVDDILDGSDGSDAIRGFSGNDILRGWAGNDMLDGGSGADTMRGGLGDDRYYVDNTGDLAIENPGEGNDIVFSSVNYRLRDNVENLSLSGSAVWAIGNSGNNRLVGNASNNILDGLAGADTMRGGAGDDRYYVDNAGDLAIENAGEGIDTVYSSISYRLRDNVENLNLTGTAVRATGNALANRLVGNSSNNILDGRAGADVMRGGLGDDRYYVDDAGDRAIENAGEGTDRVYASISFTLGANVETLFLTGTADLNGTGNSFANTLVGNAGNNVLDGGDDADTMSGGLGDDSYYADNAADIALENAAQGTDTVFSSVDYALLDNVENLTLLASAIFGTGNSLPNRIVGNDANNVLVGGAGADTMQGGHGDDAYYVDDAWDTVHENSGEGVDTIIVAFLPWYLLPDFVENGITASGSLVGNELANELSATAAASLYGQNGNDVLNGSPYDDFLDGGSGNNILVGGAGNDSYNVFSLGDQIFEGAGEGIDSVTVYVSGYTLAANVENASFGSNITGGTIIGSDANNILIGKNDRDVLYGSGGDDTLYGFYGTDTLYGGEGNDNLFGYYDGYDAGFGNDFGNVLYGEAGHDVLHGGRHNDTLDGGSGSDVLYGDPSTGDTYGSDSLSGGDGDDLLIGGRGADTMAGGAGTDTFQYQRADTAESTTAGYDIITHFTSGTDKIDVSTIDANTGVSGDQAFGWVLFSTGAAGQAWTAWDGTYTHIYLDVNGGGADMRIDVVGTMNSGTDFFW